MNLRRAAAIASIGLSIGCNRLVSDSESDEPLAHHPTIDYDEKLNEVMQLQRVKVEQIMKERAEQEKHAAARRECRFAELGEPQGELKKKVRPFLAYVNTHALSCDSQHPGSPTDHPNCQELREIMGTEPVRLKNSSTLFSSSLENLDSYQAFKRRIVDQLQPADRFGHLSYEKRLEQATETLSRCTFGIYQVMPEEWFPKLNWEHQGEDGRRNLYRYLTSKEFQDEVVRLIILRIGQKRDWQVPLMAAEYYGGEEKIPPLQQYLADPKKDDYSPEELAQKWPLIFAKRYRVHPSVWSYIQKHEDRMKKYASEEDCDYEHLEQAARIRLFRYSLAVKEADFNMFEFEHEQYEKRGW